MKGWKNLWLNFLTGLYTLLGPFFWGFATLLALTLFLVSRGSIPQTLPETFPIYICYFRYDSGHIPFIVWNFFYGGFLLLSAWGFYRRNRTLYRFYLIISFLDHFAWLAQGQRAIFTLEMSGFLLTVGCASQFDRAVKIEMPPQEGQEG